MGTRATKQNKQEKEHNESIKDLSTQTKKTKLLQLKQKLITDQDLNNCKLIKYPVSLLYSVDTAINQLDRKGKNLVKADLIALVISLKPEYMNMINELQTKFTVDDLNCLIRNIIYDPDYLEKKIKQRKIISISNTNRSLPTIYENHDLITDLSQ